MAKNDTKMPRSEKSIDKFAGFVSKNRVVLITVVCLVLAGLIGFTVFEKVSTATTEKQLGVIDQAEYSLITGTTGLSEAELVSYYDAALKAVEPYTAKGGIVGARADLLTAEIMFRRNDFKTARESYLSAAKKAKGTYLAPICYFNAATASEELNDNEKALEYYTVAADDKEFADPSHALFSIGRLKEATLDYVGAKETYEKITAKENTQDPWYNLAKTRIISLQIDGKAE